MKRLFRGLAALILLAGFCLCAASAMALEQEPGWIDNPEGVSDYAFSLAFVGDTQIIARYYPDEMHHIYDWLLAIREERNLQAVIGLGDITDATTDDEWCVASYEISRMNGEIPYTLLRGNHDDPYSFTAYLDDSSYRDNLGGYYDDNILNSYMTLTVGTINYLILNVDFGPTDQELLWASNVVKTYPYHNVIVVTHGYMDSDGVLLTPQTSKYAPSDLGGVNDGPAIWEQLVKKHPNIIMVVCGHISHPVIAVHEATGDHGNRIQQVLIDPQEMDRTEGPGGNVALFHFSADGKQVQVENYATIPGRYYGTNLKFEVNCLGGNALEKRGVPMEPEEKPAAPAPDPVAVLVEKVFSPPVLIAIAVLTVAEILLVAYLVKSARKKTAPNSADK